ncbi:MAG: low molecular weight phosphatase family protein [Candidatus Acidiferrales bacterium]
MAEPVKVLFVCMGNCVRSQMAEAIARHDASDIITAESAGVHPLGFIDNTTQRVLRERGISFDGQFSKGTRDHSLQKPDLIVNMSGVSGASLFAGLTFEDWQIRDPFGEAIELHRSICDDIEQHVKELAVRLRRSQPKQDADAGSQTDSESP